MSAIKIGHAVSDENGGSGGIAGDQTGKEIRTQTWYNRSGGWDYYIECTDEELAKKAAEWMKAICECSKFGYSKKNRWTGYKAILAAGSDISKLDECEAGDFDCSSLCLACYILAGLKHKASGYTQSMRKSLLATGKFVSTNSKDRIGTSDYAKVGGLYLSEGHHVCMALEDGPKAAKASDEKKEENEGEKIPQVEILGNVNIRKEPSTFSKIIGIAHKGDRFDYLTEAKDAKGNTWYAISYKDGFAFVSGFSDKKKKYTRLDI